MHFNFKSEKKTVLKKTDPNSFKKKKKNQNDIYFGMKLLKISCYVQILISSVRFTIHFSMRIRKVQKVKFKSTNREYIPG